MAGYGDTFSKMVGGYYKPDSKEAATASLFGNAYDFYDAYTSKKDAETQNKIAQQMSAQAAANQAAIAQAQAENEALIKKRVMNRIAEFDGALKETYSRMGARMNVDPEDIQANYDLLRKQGYDDLNAITDRVSSTGFANAIRRGMDGSGLYKDEQAALATKLQKNYQKVDQAAFDAAIMRTNSFANAVNSGRDKALSEVSTVYGKPIDAEKGLITNNANSYMNTAFNNANKSATASADAMNNADTYLGNVVGTIDEKLPGAVSYLAGNTNTMKNKDADEAARLRKLLEANNINIPKA